MARPGPARQFVAARSLVHSQKVPQKHRLLDVRETLTPSDHQSHRRFRFQVPAHCAQLDIHVAYSPKHLDEQSSTDLAWSALRSQSKQLAERVGDELAARWSADLSQRAARVRIP